MIESTRTAQPETTAPAGALRAPSGARLPASARLPDAAFDDAQALGFVLDLLPVGIVLVDERARVLWRNRPAQRRIDEGQALVVREGRLAARSHADTLTLRRVLERACEAARTTGRHAPEVLALSAASETHGRLVIVARGIERSSACRPQERAAVVLFLSDDEHQLGASRQRLRALFDLTPAESELTALLAAGCSLRAAAGRLGITLESARTYLKRALQKTGTRRQAELVRLVLSVATAGEDEV